MRIEIFQPQAISEKGSRKNQEDSIFPIVGQATPHDYFFILCDGMGGHENGEVASRLVCETVSSYIIQHCDGVLFSDQILNNALEAAFTQIDTLDDGSPQKPGTTFSFACLHSGGATIAHIGDSRIYHIRPSEHRILYKSRDHSLVYDLFMTGEITKDEMRSYAKKNIITRAILPNQDRKPKADIVHIANIKTDDYFYLCSDGMLEQMDDLQLLTLICSDSSDEEKRSQLIEATRENKDNHSAYLIHILNVETEDGDISLQDDEENMHRNAILLEAKNAVVSKPSRSIELNDLTNSKTLWLAVIIVSAILFLFVALSKCISHGFL